MFKGGIMKQFVLISLVLLFTGEAKALRVSVLPFSCEHPQCESSSGTGMAKAISNALKVRGIEVVERWGGPDYIIQGEIKDFDLENPDALVSLEAKVIEAKAGKLIKILNADGHSYEATGGISLPYEFFRWRGKPGENAIISAVTNMAEKILNAISDKGLQSPSGIDRGVVFQKAQSGEIKGGARFVPGEKTLFFSDLSKYEIGDVPKGFKIEGQVEIAEFKGKKWIRAISKEGVISIPLKLQGDWSCEMSYYWAFKERDLSDVYFGIKEGDQERALRLWVGSYWESMEWKEKELSGFSFPTLNEIHTVSFSKKGNLFRIFIDGVMVVNELEEESGIRGSEIKKSEIIFIKFNNVKPSEGNEFLLGDIKIAGYK